MNALQALRHVEKLRECESACETIQMGEGRRLGANHRGFDRGCAETSPGKGGSQGGGANPGGLLLPVFNPGTSLERVRSRSRLGNLIFLQCQA